MTSETPAPMPPLFLAALFATELSGFVNDRLVQYYLDQGYTIPQIKAVAIATGRHFPSLGV